MGILGGEEVNVHKLETSLEDVSERASSLSQAWPTVLTEPGGDSVAKNWWAADLIKSFVFQKLGQEGVNTERAYAEEWPFDRKFWETEVSVGRYNISRSWLFNQWLGSRLGEKISPRSTSRVAATMSLTSWR